MTQIDTALLIKSFQGMQALVPVKQVVAWKCIYCRQQAETAASVVHAADCSWVKVTNKIVRDCCTNHQAKVEK